MLDLKKLEENFKYLFEQETEESFNEWLEDKKKKEILARLGSGNFEKINPPVTQGLKFHCHKTMDFTGENSGQVPNNAQYAMAA